jgi:TonB family protein
MCAVGMCLLAPTSRQLAAQQTVPFWLGIELIDDSGNAWEPLGQYMAKIHRAVKANVQSAMTDSITKEQGLVTVEIQIRKDGKATDLAAPKIVASDDNKVLEDFSIAALRKAAPFDPLPAGSPAPLRFRLTFRYNLPKR